MTGPRLYRRSALASGFVRMWRGWRVLLPVVALNALVQAVLVAWPAYPSDAWIAASAVASGLVFGAAYALVVSAALQVPDGIVTWSGAISLLRGRVWRFAAWAVAWLLVVGVGFALYTVPGVVAAALLPFLLIAVVDGRTNPLGVNVRTIGRRFWRWLVTLVIVGILLFLGDLVTGFFTFFIRNPLAALVVWLVAGVGVAWVTTTWALIYRRAWAEPAELATDVVPETPDLEPTP